MKLDLGKKVVDIPAADVWDYPLVKNTANNILLPLVPTHYGKGVTALPKHGVGNVQVDGRSPSAKKVQVDESQNELVLFNKSNPGRQVRSHGMSPLERKKKEFVTVFRIMQFVSNETKSLDEPSVTLVYPQKEAISVESKKGVVESLYQSLLSCKSSRKKTL